MEKNVNMELSELLRCESVAIELAHDAGLMMSNASGKNREINEKESYADLVTETDKAVENYVFGQLKKHFPEHKFIGEETSSKVGLSDAPTWVVDPVDGTMNFVHQFPYVCISIALVVSKEPVLGVIYSPFLDKLYTAKKGFGAFCNGKPIHVKTGCKRLHDALIATEFGSTRDDAKRNAIYKNLEAVGWDCHGVRCMGSAALNICSVANGHTEAYYEFGIHIWDYAAGSLILTEAGGTVIDTEGGPLDLLARRIIGAANESLANELSRSLVCHLKLERD